MRVLYLIGGWLALLLAGIGIALPLLPTVPLVILAAFCFARSSPRLEAWLMQHPQMGPHISAWRTRGAVSRRGKYAAALAFAVGIATSLVFAPWPWPLAPIVAAGICVPWLWSRPDA
ncbi:MAG: DUF454 domain-containing protein [Sphingopyxis sp.]|nr:DUF454 domain-containing protein [Sphingopyxis sp.]